MMYRHKARGCNYSPLRFSFFYTLYKFLETVDKSDNAMKEYRHMNQPPLDHYFLNLAYHLY